MRIYTVVKRSETQFIVRFFAFNGEIMRFDSAQDGGSSVEMAREWMPPGTRIVKDFKYPEHLWDKGTVEVWVDQ